MFDINRFRVLTLQEEVEQVALVITTIHLHRTPALFYEGACERGPRFDESPFKLAVTGESGASITPDTPIHHLIRTLGQAEQTRGKGTQPRSLNKLNHRCTFWE